MKTPKGPGGWSAGRPGMPHQEIYLAALDQQSADAMSRLAALMNDAITPRRSAHKKAEEIRAKLEPEYYDSAAQFYAFSRNADGSLDRTATIYPAVAWWTGRLALAARGCNAQPLGVSRILRRLGHARHQRTHAFLRSHQLSPRLHLAAVHRLGFARRVSRRTSAVRLRAPDAKRGADLGAGFGIA